ncbi:MAG TPA: DNA-binding protein, partial [Mycobacterium sp.]|nr:DNA-binding protein [Mycobacterium sp.]
FDPDTRLRLVDCPDRHLGRAAQELVLQALDEYPDAKVTVVLPRRSYAPLVGRLLHDRTADKMARAVSRIEGATAIIVPYDIGSRVAQVIPDRFEQRIARGVGNVLTWITRVEEHEHPERPPAVIAEEGLIPGRPVTTESSSNRGSEV